MSLMYIFFLAKIDQLLRNVASITAELAVMQEQVTLLSRKRVNEDSDDVTAEVKTLPLMKLKILKNQ